MRFQLNRFGRRWAKMRFRHQLTISHVGMLVFGLAVMSAAILYLSNDILMKRGFDLLEATNVVSLKRLNDHLGDARLGAESCGPGADIQWKQFEASGLVLDRQTFLRAQAPGGPTINVITGNKPQISVRFQCWPDREHVTVAQISPNWLTQVFVDRTGLGESGENYLVASSGQLITGSRFLEDPNLAPIPHQKSDHYLILKHDYRDIPVLADWRAVRIGDFQGYLASEIDVAEVRQPVRRLAQATLVVAILVGLFVSLLVPRLSILLSKNVERALELESVRSRAIFEGQENERHRISLELHDDIGQKMTALAWRISAAPIDREQANTFAKTVRMIASDLRGLTSGLSNAVLKTLGVYESLHQLLRDMKSLAETRQIAFTYQIDGNAEDFAKLSQDFGVAIYRVTQESLNNMMKYSQARNGRCEVSLIDGRVSLKIKDDGAGFDVSQLKTGTGLKIMKIRIESLGGSLNIDSKLGVGTTIEAKLSLRQAELHV